MGQKASKDKKDTHKNQHKNSQSSDDHLSQPKLENKLQTKYGLTIFGTSDGSIIMSSTTKNKIIKKILKLLTKSYGILDFKYVTSITALADGKY